MIQEGINGLKNLQESNCSLESLGENENVVLVKGPSGSGKSFLIGWLRGAQFTHEETRGRKMKINVKEQQYPQIANKSKEQTPYHKVYKGCMNREQDHAFIDTPCHLKIEEDQEKQLMEINLFNKLDRLKPKVKIVFTLDSLSVEEGRGKSILQTIKSFSQFIKKNALSGPCYSFAITKVQPKGQGQEKYYEEMIKDIIESGQSEEKNRESLLKFLGENKVFIIPYYTSCSQEARKKAWKRIKKMNAYQFGQGYRRELPEKIRKYLEDKIKQLDGQLTNIRKEIHAELKQNLDRKIKEEDPRSLEKQILFSLNSLGRKSNQYLNYLQRKEQQLNHQQDVKMIKQTMNKFGVDPESKMNFEQKVTQCFQNRSMLQGFLPSPGNCQALRLYHYQFYLTLSRCLIDLRQRQVRGKKPKNEVMEEEFDENKQDTHSSELS